MREDLFQIGEVAAMFHVSVSTLRHYAQLGLVTPEYVDPDTGYRYYSTDQFETLNTLRYLRVLDMPLEKIAAFLECRSIPSMETLLLAQKEEVRRQQEALRRIEKKLDRRLALLAEARASVLDTVVELPPQTGRIVWLRCELPAEDARAIETPLKQLERNQRDPIIFLGKAGVGISREHLAQGRFGRYDAVFLLLDEEDDYSGSVEPLPDLPCVALRFRGRHRDAQPYYARLMEYLRAHGRAPAGFSREITLIDEGLSSDPAEFVTEIQIPYRD